MQKTSQTSRREFLQTTGGLLAGAALVGSTGRGLHAAGNDKTFNVGLVGCGGRGRGAAVNVMKNTGYGNVKLVAVADAFQHAVDGTVKALTAQFADQCDLVPERCFSGLDCCEKLLKTDVDVVLLCEPPGFRPRNFVAAVEAGKHVFAEKPVAVDAVGIRMIREASRKAKDNKQLVMVGHHLRYEDKHVEPINMIRDGAIGDLVCMRIYFNQGHLWTRPRQEGQTEMQHQVSNWYYFNWLSGDHIVEQHVHDIDVMNWIAGDKVPVSANGMGGRQVRIGPQYGEIFDHHAVEYTYDDGVKGFSYCRQIPGCWNAFSEHAHGSLGHVDMDGHGTVKMYRKGKDPIVWKRDKDGHQTEIDVLFDALSSGKYVNTGELAADASMTAILGRMATYGGKIVTWDEGAGSQLDLFPKSLAWDADPGPKPAPDGIYPCAVPGVTKAW